LNKKKKAILKESLIKNWGKPKRKLN